MTKDFTEDPKFLAHPKLNGRTVVSKKKCESCGDVEEADLDDGTTMRGEACLCSETTTVMNHLRVIAPLVEQADTFVKARDIFYPVIRLIACDPRLNETIRSSKEFRSMMDKAIERYKSEFLKS